MVSYFVFLSWFDCFEKAWLQLFCTSNLQSKPIRIVFLLRGANLQFYKFLGQHVNCMWRVRAKLTDPSTSQRVLAMNEKKHVTWYATLDGALGKHFLLTEHIDLTS